MNDEQKEMFGDRVMTGYRDGVDWSQFMPVEKREGTMPKGDVQGTPILDS